MSESLDDFFTRDHKKLIRFASFADVFAWIALAVYVLLAFGQITQLIPLTEQLNLPSIVTTIIKIPIVVILPMLNNLLKAVFYWIVLRGISLGLNMIVETDLNYREQSPEAGDG
jgi:hypothetical protein